MSAEETWLLRESSSVDEFMALEARVNERFHGDDCLLLCQYDRERFPAEVVRDVLKTHTHLVADGTVSENFHYTPPEEFLAPEDPEREVDQMMRTVRERSEAKTELREHKRYLRELYETTADVDASFEEKVERLLELGCERFDLAGGALANRPDADGDFRLEVAVGDEMPDEPGVLPTQSEEGCFCRQAITRDEPTAAPDIVETGWDDDAVYQEFGFTSYFGTRVTAGNDPYGTLWFYDTTPRAEPFTEDERTFLELMGQWVSDELERTERDRAQRELYDITADTDLSYEEKVDRLLDLGRDRFGLDMGFFLKKEGDEFRVVRTRGTDLENGVTTLSACPGNYCKQTITVEKPVSVEDTTAVGWDDDPLYREYGFGCYIGTRVTDGDGVYGSVCFADSDSRSREFTEAEHTFLDLMGQWLSHEVEQRRRERELEETVQRLQQSNERLKQFAYAASHDLQEPLRMVSSYLRLLENRHANDLDEEAREYVDFAVDGADRMRAMVDDLLSFSRVEHADGEFEPVDCETLVDRVTDDLRVQIEESGAEVVVDPLPTVTADPEQLEQLFSNLVSNAIEYNEADPPRVEISVEGTPDEWVFTVADNGIGIDPEYSDRVFEVFKRLHHDDEYSGTGIGLSLCQEIVENHGGDIRVDSQPGEGSTFSVSLPRRTAD